MQFLPSRQTLRRALSIAPVAMLLSGCNMVVMHPSGDVAMQQRDLVLIATALMLLIIVPVVALIVLFAWRYRHANKDARYEPDWDHSTQLELIIWAAPLLIIICLGAVTWVGTHLLDPYRPLDRVAAGKPIAADVAPLEVQVVALDWKWLFIYPEQGIATVNELAAPVNRPIHFKIIASSVMNSFYIPALAGQIYAMPGMETKLNAVINKPGNYAGFSANYSGAGFSGMRFRFHGMSNDDFAGWVANAKKGGGMLDRAVYLKLAEPSEKEPVRRFASIDPALYNAALNQCVVPGTPCMADVMKADAARDGEAGHGSHGAPTPSDVTPQQGPHMDHGNMTMNMTPKTGPTGRGEGLVGAGLTPPSSPFRKPEAVALDAPAHQHSL
ncbi:ubiquinol oxidase subunit II [Sphingobium sp. SCG-1]|uniref:ubiquinol oxidase subunit II n=1 Tax=Sphingobium sp. SCG-1 TaxID=2072936 RepID=UPI000CD69B58|nr:ubiquinol oxidase subunit II [Sphingobium sp. SCG-1]AUW60449.1 ubiquinol oxidase subunit II [Sphingobium sp. SCG-1]